MKDDIDRHILTLLQDDARISNAEIARKLKLAPSAVLQRIRKLRRDGFIKEFTARLNPDLVGSGLLAFVAVRINEKASRRDVEKTISEIPEVLEVHAITGEDSYLLKLRTRNARTLYELLKDIFSCTDGIASTKTMVVLHTAKLTTKLPVGRDEGLKKRK